MKHAFSFQVEEAAGYVRKGIDAVLQNSEPIRDQLSWLIYNGKYLVFLNPVCDSLSMSLSRTVTVFCSPLRHRAPRGLRATPRSRQVQPVRRHLAQLQCARARMRASALQSPPPGLARAAVSRRRARLRVCARLRPHHRQGTPGANPFSHPVKLFSSSCTSRVLASAVCNAASRKFASCASGTLSRLRQPAPSPPPSPPLPLPPHLPLPLPLIPPLLLTTPPPALPH